jgi:hypothetical protein
VAVAALVFYHWGVRSGWSTPALQAVQAVQAEETRAARVENGVGYVGSTT